MLDRASAETIDNLVGIVEAPAQAVSYAAVHKTMNQHSKRHHYVPVFYLRRFADQSGRLDAYHRTTGERIKVSAANAALESRLYEVIDQEGQRTDAAERTIACIESKVAPGFEALVSGPWPPLLEARGLIANFIALQGTRTRESLHAIAAITDRMTKLEMSLLPRERWRELYVEAEGVEPTEDELDGLVADFKDFDSYRIEPHPNTQIEGMFKGAATLVQPIADRKWFLQVCRAPWFITSDEPVHMWSAPHRAAHGVGVFTADELWLPIDSHHNLLMVYDSRGYEERRVEIPRSSALEVSQRIASSSYEWVFADPRRGVLDQLHLPTGPRPIATISGETIWGPGSVR